MRSIQHVIFPLGDFINLYNDLLVLCPFWDMTISLRQPLRQALFATSLLWDMSFILQQPLWDMTILRHDIFTTLTIMRHDHFETCFFSYFIIWSMIFFSSTSGPHNNQPPKNHLLDLDYFSNCEFSYKEQKSVSKSHSLI